MFVNNLVDFIENHPQLINLLTFLAGIAFAWFTGALKVIKSLSGKLENKIRVNINKTTATMTILKEFKHKEFPAQRFSFCLSVNIKNPTDKIQTISEFELRFKDKRNQWSKSLAPVSMPSIPKNVNWKQL